MWNIYDKLIQTVPEHLTVDRITQGDTWTFVASGNRRGIAITVNEQGKPLPSFADYRGASLRELSALCKSWDFAEASVGTAALNAYFNIREDIQKIGATKTDGGFDDYKKIAAGKKVAIIGHFFHLERFLTESEVYVLERNPEPGDYPDPACEYILPEMDFTFITGSAFINKTLPRLLQLSRYGVVLGPSTPMSPLLLSDPDNSNRTDNFKGAKELSGLVLSPLSQEDELAAAKGGMRIGSLGTRYRLIR